MSRPDSMTGCESDEISQKMCLGDAVGASDLQMLDAPLFQHIRVIPEHHTVRITGIQIFLAQIILLLYTNSFNFRK